MMAPWLFVDFILLANCVESRCNLAGLGLAIRRGFHFRNTMLRLVYPQTVAVPGKTFYVEEVYSWCLESWHAQDQSGDLRLKSEDLCSGMLVFDAKST